MVNIDRYENAAMLDLPEAERRRVAGAAQRLLDDFSALGVVDTGGVDPMMSVLEIKNVMREDVSERTISRDELLHGAPDSCDGFFRVPRTLALD